MAVAKENKTGRRTHIRVKKNTCQNGSKTSTQNKCKRVKRYRGQGR